MALLQKIYISYANLFVITRPLDTFSSISMNAAILIQPVQCLVNIIFIPVYLSFGNDQTPDSGFQIMKPEVILVLTLVNIILCFNSKRFTCSCSYYRTYQGSYRDKDSTANVILCKIEQSY